MSYLVIRDFVLDSQYFHSACLLRADTRSETEREAAISKGTDSSYKKPLFLQVITHCYESKLQTRYCQGGSERDTLDLYIGLLMQLDAASVNDGLIAEIATDHGIEL